MNLQLAYSQIATNQNIKYSYHFEDGFCAYNQNSLEVYIFRATDYKHIAIVKRWYGNFKIREL